MEFNNERRRERGREREKVVVVFGKVQSFFSLPTIIIETNLYFTFSSPSRRRALSPPSAFSPMLYASKQQAKISFDQAKAIYESFKLPRFFLSVSLSSSSCSFRFLHKHYSVALLPSLTGLLEYCVASPVYTHKHAYIYISGRTQEQRLIIFVLCLETQRKITQRRGEEKGMFGMFHLSSL